jgi:hypothetical protein
LGARERDPAAGRPAQLGVADPRDLTSGGAAARSATCVGSECELLLLPGLIHHTMHLPIK